MPNERSVGSDPGSRDATSIPESIDAYLADVAAFEAGSGTPAPGDGKQRILDAAAELFLTRGYAETSIRLIADAVGIKPASIYHHFTNKDSLLTEILEIGMLAVDRAFDDAAASTPPEPADRLERHVAAHLEALFAHHAFTATHVTVFPFAPPAVRNAAVAARDDYEARWAELLGEIAPQLEPDALRIARLALFGAMNSSVQWFDPKTSSTADLASAIARTVAHGMIPTGAS